MIFHQAVTTQWLTFFYPSFFSQLRHFPEFNSKNLVTCIFLCPLKLQVFILWTSTADLLLSPHLVSVQTATRRTGPPSPGASAPMGLCPAPSAPQRDGSSWAANPARTPVTGMEVLQRDLIQLTCRCPPACVELCCLISPVSLEA